MYKPTTDSNRTYRKTKKNTLLFSSKPISGAAQQLVDKLKTDRKETGGFLICKSKRGLEEDTIVRQHVQDKFLLNSFARKYNEKILKNDKAFAIRCCVDNVKRTIEQHEKLLKNLCDNDTSYKQFRNQTQIFEMKMTHLTNYSFFCSGYGVASSKKDHHAAFSYDDFCFRCKDRNALVVVVDCPRMCSVMCLACTMTFSPSFDVITDEFDFDVCPVCQEQCSAFFFRVKRSESGLLNIVAPENSTKYAKFLAETGENQTGFYNYLLKKEEKTLMVENDMSAINNLLTDEKATDLMVSASSKTDKESVMQETGNNIIQNDLLQQAIIESEIDIYI